MVLLNMATITHSKRMLLLSLHGLCFSMVEAAG